MPGLRNIFRERDETVVLLVLVALLAATYYQSDHQTTELVFC